MRVRVLAELASSFGRLAPGQEIELPAHTAEAWVVAGVAESLEAVIQEAIAPAAPERAVAPRARKGARNG